MRTAIALAPYFGKGVGVTVAGIILFVGSVYLLLGAIFGLRMGYLVLAVSFFGWMIILSALWAFGVPGTPPHLGPRGTEPHWQVFAAGTGTVSSTRFPNTERFPELPWHPPDRVSLPSVDTAKTAIQEYLVQRANEQLAREGGEHEALEDADFVVQDVHFATAEDTHLVGANAFFQGGGPQVTVFAYHNQGNVPVYSWSFLAASVLGFAVHLPFLDRAERKRKAILTGGTAPPWYGPA